MIWMMWWAWLATIAISCGHPSAPANPKPGTGTPATPPPDAAVDALVALEHDLPRLAERAVKLYADWSVALREAGDDCAQATTKMNAIADANLDVIDANRRVLRGPRDRVKALRAELEKHQAALDASAKSIVESPTMRKCSTDPAFARASDRLGGEG
jgi:hypothetical protein